MLVEEEYWNRFLETGKITDYLYYKGMAICREVMERHEKERIAGLESDGTYRNGADSGACGRI